MPDPKAPPPMATLPETTLPDLPPEVLQLIRENPQFAQMILQHVTDGLPKLPPPRYTPFYDPSNDPIYKQMTEARQRRMRIRALDFKTWLKQTPAQRKKDARFEKLLDPIMGEREQMIVDQEQQRRAPWDQLLEKRRLQDLYKELQDKKLVEPGEDVTVI